MENITKYSSELLAKAIEIMHRKDKDSIISVYFTSQILSELIELNWQNELFNKQELEKIKSAAKTKAKELTNMYLRTK